MSSPDFELNRALELFTSGTDAEAQAGFEALMKRARVFIDAYLKNHLSRVEDREEVAQEVAIRLLARKTVFVNKGIPSWWSFVAQAAYWKADDVRRRSGREELGKELEPPSSDPSAYEIVEFVEQRRTIRRYADELWLGVDPRRKQPEHRRREMAWTYHYVDGHSWPVVLRLLAAGCPGCEAPTREDLDTWLGDPTVFATVACRQLHHGQDRLIWHLLGLEGAPDSAQLDELLCRAVAQGPGAPPERWTWAETAVLMWRYRHAMHLSQIVRLEGCALTLPEVKDLLDRSLAFFPFIPQMDQILAWSTSPSARPALDKSPFWQRLVFEYALESLPHLDIHERTAPPAGLVGYRLTTGMINVWIANGRLFDRLIAYAKKRMKEDCPSQTETTAGSL